MRRLALTAAVLGALVFPAATAAVTGITVFAASSLTQVFPKIDAGPRYSFGGSDSLALQIRNGAPADVFASASPVQARTLYREELLLRPQPRIDVLLVDLRLGPEHDRGAEAVELRGRRLVGEPLDEVAAGVGEDAGGGVAMVDDGEDAQAARRPGAATAV